MLSNFLSKLAIKIGNQSDFFQAVLLIQLGVAGVLFAILQPLTAICLAVTFGLVYIKTDK